MNARHGKITRLPGEIRGQLNERLKQSGQSPQLLDWLNALKEVKKVAKRVKPTLTERPVQHVREIIAKKVDKPLDENEIAGGETEQSSQDQSNPVKVNQADFFTETPAENSKNDLCPSTNAQLMTKPGCRSFVIGSFRH